MNSLEIFKGNNHIDCSNTLLNLISSEINDSEKYSLGLSGGSTPEFFYELFAKKYKYLCVLFSFSILTTLPLFSIPLLISNVEPSSK